ncbi:basement membrane-specific heparan sulfate proteoglycan core protein [Amia ocellicauda]|uniref:basement membrane-specific heparan sulfate proteoglycan core protein n=1 Tax=Amia ocellicauda TaxID=2972642 RepID=UPI003463A2A0
MLLIIFTATFLTTVSQAFPISVSVPVGDSVFLPCYGAVAVRMREEQLHVLWKTQRYTLIYSQHGSTYISPGLKGRAEIPRERVTQGDFSLTIRNVSFSDEGQYECSCKGIDDLELFAYYHLIVTDRRHDSPGQQPGADLTHSDSHTLRSGAALSFLLFAAEPVEVLFAAAGDGASVSVCAVERGAAIRLGPGYEHRVSVWAGSLNLHSLTPADQGQYTVRDCRTNQTISTISVTVRAHSDSHTLQSGAALSLPLFTAEPVEVLFAAAGEGASVSVCAVESDAASRPGPGYEHRVSVQSGSLTLRSLTAADQGNYTVRDSRTNLTISTVTVTVRVHSETLTLPSGAALSLPLFTAEPVEVLFAAAGEGASVSVCAVERGAASRPGPGYEHRVSVWADSLTLRSLTAADQGQYTVRDSRTNHTISTVSVTVRVPVSVSVGDSVSLPCDGAATAGIPEEELHILWRTLDETVMESSHGHANPGRRFKGRAEVSRERVRKGDFSLTIHNVASSDDDTYWCFYKNGDELVFLVYYRLIVTARHEDSPGQQPGADLSIPPDTSTPTISVEDGDLCPWAMASIVIGAMGFAVIGGIVLWQLWSCGKRGEAAKQDKGDGHTRDKNPFPSKDVYRPPKHQLDEVLEKPPVKIMPDMWSLVIKKILLTLNLISRADLGPIHEVNQTDRWLSPAGQALWRAGLEEGEEGEEGWRLQGTVPSDV